MVILMRHFLLQLCLCKEQVQKEMSMKNEALKQLVSSQQLLHMKTEVNFFLQYCSKNYLFNSFRVKYYIVKLSLKFCSNLCRSLINLLWSPRGCKKGIWHWPKSSQHLNCKCLSIFVCSTISVTFFCCGLKVRSA